MYSLFNKMLNNIIYKFGKYIRYLPNSIVFGRTFNSAKLLQDEYLKSNDKIGYVEEYQYNSLRTLLSVANRVKYYKNKEYELNIDLFNKIPFVNKSIMNNDISQFIDTKKGAVYGSTGGTSGKPFGFYINKNRRGREWFWMTDNWSRVGFDRNSSYRGVLRNHILPNNVPYIKNTFLREYYFSNYNTTDSYLEKIVTYLNNYQIEFIHAYPSAAHRLAKYLLNNNQTIPSVKAFLCGSENIYPEQRSTIENQLGVRLYSWYGHSEKLILAGECEFSSNYHAIPFYGYAELVDEQGNNITQPGEVGELVGTGFINTAMPFIRYRTGDYATFVGNQCPHCGRVGLVFNQVKGRWDGEKIYATNGSFCTTTALNMHSDIYKNIEDMQYYQDTPGKLEVRIIPGSGYSKKDDDYIKRSLTEKLGDDFSLSIVKVIELEYTINRKYILLIQKLKDKKNISKISAQN